MSVIDRFIAAVSPPETDEARLEARTKATKAAMPGDWLDQILQRLMDLEDAFADFKAASDSASRNAATELLGVLLTGHAIAEGAVIYPALAEGGEKAHAGVRCGEQAMVKVQMALLEKSEPMSKDFLDKFEHIQGAVQHHIHAEEGNWFLAIKEKTSAADQTLMTKRYGEEYARYVGADAPT